MTGLLDRSVSELGGLLRTRQLSILDLVGSGLATIEAHRDLQAFIAVDRDGALAAAHALQARLDAGDDLGPLHGIPMAVKDNIDIAGQDTTAGSILLRGNIATRDATVVARLRAAGAVLIGRTNMHELAWGGTTDNPHYGRARNPWDTGRIPAGSSGGSGIAVAAGMVSAALGTDTGGSVRLPASVNGVSGLRPTIGRVSTAGVVPLAWTMDTVGPLARRADDVRLVHNAIAGWDPRDRVSRTDAFVPQEPAGQGLRGLRIGVIADYALTGCQPDVADAIGDALATMQDAGAHVEEISVPGAAELVDAQIVIDAVEPSAMHVETLRTRPQDYGADVRTHLQAGLVFTGVQYVQAQRYRAWFRDRLLEAMAGSPGGPGRVDLLVTPTLPFTALPHGATSVTIGGREQSLTAGNMKYTAIGSMTGFPALSIPAGFDRDGLPIGMLLTGRPFAEETLLAAAASFQTITGHHLRAPFDQ